MPVELQIADDKLSSVIIPHDMLKPHTGYNATIKIKAEEYNFTTHAWAISKKSKW